MPSLSLSLSFSVGSKSTFTLTISPSNPQSICHFLSLLFSTKNKTTSSILWKNQTFPLHNYIFLYIYIYIFNTFENIAIFDSPKFAFVICNLFVSSHILVTSVKFLVHFIIFLSCLLHLIRFQWQSKYSLLISTTKLLFLPQNFIWVWLLLSSTFLLSFFFLTENWVFKLVCVTDL